MRIPNTLVDLARIIFFYTWLWFISQIDKISKKEKGEKNKRKLEVVKAVEKAKEVYKYTFKTLITYFSFFNLGWSVPSNNPKIIAYKPTKTPIIWIAFRKSWEIKLFILHLLDFLFET